MRLSTSDVWKTALRLITGVILLGALAGCGLLSDDDTPALIPTSDALPAATGTTEPDPTATSTATVKPTATLSPTIEPTATAQPTIPIDDLQPSAKLAYFHTTAEGGDPADVLAQRADIVILTPGDEAFRDALRAAGYTGTILQYLNASQVNGPGPYASSDAACDDSFGPRRNGFPRTIGTFCADLHPHEDWFLHNGAGDRLYSIVGDVGVWYHMNPGNDEWRAYASQAIAAELVGPQALGYDGAFLDNVELSLTKLSQQIANSDGQVLEYADDAAYHAAWSGYLEQIRARVGQERQLWAGLVADPNQGALWADYLAPLDGAMSPAFATGYDPLPAVKWDNNLSQAEDAISAGKGIIAVGLGRQDDIATQRFAFASYLLIADGSHAYFRYLSDVSDNSANMLWMYPDYEIILGAALGPRQKDGSVWRREFQCGYVEVDPVARTGTIQQTSCRNGTAP